MSADRETGHRNFNAPGAAPNTVRRRIERGFVDVRDDVDGDIEVIGGQANVYATVRGNLVIRGGRATVHGIVTGDVINDGGHVVVLGQVGGRISGSREYTIVERPRRSSARTAAKVPTGGERPQQHRRPHVAVAAAAAAFCLVGVSVAAWWFSDFGGSDPNPAAQTKVAGAVEEQPPANPIDEPRVEIGTARAVVPAAIAATCHPSYYPCVPMAAIVRCIGVDALAGTVAEDEIVIAIEVGVAGSDEYGLDADGDGIGCNEQP